MKRQNCQALPKIILKQNNKHIKNNTFEQQILNFSSAYSVPAEKSKKTVWDELSKKLDDNKISTTEKPFRLLYKIAAAAVVLIISSIAFLYSGSKITTGFAQNKEIYLPDSSYVFLQAGSSISFNKRLWNSGREVKLNGEAYFSVKKGSKFTVKTQTGSVQVLGTKFNVISRNLQFTVACVTGRVRVSLEKSKAEVILTKGLFTKETKNGQLTKASVKSIDEIMKRNKGAFYFEKTDLKLVFEELERQFDVKIEYKDIENRQFTGYFANKNLETALKMVCKPMELEYTVNNRLVVIKNLAKLNK